MSDPGTPAPAPVQQAGFWRRAAARAIDMLTTAGIAIAWMMVATVIAALMTAGSFWDDLGPFYTVFGLLCVPMLVVVARYEAAYVARRGQTFGKGLAGIRVVCWDAEQGSASDPLRPPDLFGSVVRWAIPHGSGLLVGVVASMVALPRIKDFGGYVGAGAGVAMWALVYASSLFDKNGRGWHDKAAGTVITDAPRHYRSAQGPEIPQNWQGWRGVPFS